jgi:hypothetical protein
LRPALPLEDSSCTETSPTRYAKKLSDDAVLVMVTTAVPLQAASVSNTHAADAGASFAQVLCLVNCNLEQDAFIAWVDPRKGLLFSESWRKRSGG